MASEQLKQNGKGKVPPSREIEMPVVQPEAKEEAVVVAGAAELQNRAQQNDAGVPSKGVARKRKVAKVEVEESGKQQDYSIKQFLFR